MNGINKVVVKQYLIIEITSIMLHFFYFVSSYVCAFSLLIVKQIFFFDSFEITLEVVMTIFNYLFLFMSVLSHGECTDFLV